MKPPAARCTVCNQHPVTAPTHTMCPGCYKRFRKIDDAASNPDGIRRDMVDAGNPVNPNMWTPE